MLLSVLASLTLASGTATIPAPTVLIEPAPLEPVAAGPVAAGDLDFPMVAQRYLERHGSTVTDPKQIDLFPFLADHHARVELGAFAVHIPASALEDRTEFELTRTVCHELAAAQMTWLEWLHQGSDSKALKDSKAEKHTKALKKWINSWRHQSWLADYRRGVRNFTPTAEDNAKLFESSQTLNDLLGRGVPMQTGRAEPVFTPIYLIPKREDFVEIACLFGWIYPHLRHEYWQQNTWSWTQFFFEDAWFFALEFAASTDSDKKEVQGFTGDYTQGSAMVNFNPQGLEQQLVQLSLRGLIQNLFGDRISPAFSAGLSSLLVIDIYGEVDTRTDGDLRPKKTQARSVFVPGGASGGGALPPNYADGRFRSPKHGADYFIPVLQRVQAAGAKDVREKDEKHRTFEILDEDQADQFHLQAPLLHFSTEKRVRAPHPKFGGDMLEFLRAYRICFMHWLREESYSSKSKSHTQFARFLAALAAPDATLESALEEVYEKPLSDEAASKGTLEGSFLRWLEG